MRCFHPASDLFYQNVIPKHNVYLDRTDSVRLDRLSFQVLDFAYHCWYSHMRSILHSCHFRTSRKFIFVLMPVYHSINKNYYFPEHGLAFGSMTMEDNQKRWTESSISSSNSGNSECFLYSLIVWLLLIAIVVVHKSPAVVLQRWPWGEQTRFRLTPAAKTYHPRIVRPGQSDCMHYLLRSTGAIQILSGRVRRHFSRINSSFVKIC